MANKRLGAQTVRFDSPPVVVGRGAVGGPMEVEGPLGEMFDKVYEDLTAGQGSFEKAERLMLEDACKAALTRAGEDPSSPKVDYFLAGDLLNQIISSTFSALQLKLPFFGLYGACSTFCESISLGAMLIDGGYADKVLCGTVSHNATSERQFRYPTEYGSQRRPYAQWTVTAAGAVVLAAQGTGPKVTHVTTGKVVDLGIKDPYNQGAAMAPAAMDTLVNHLQDTGRQLTDYDLIITGDLARFGREMLLQLAEERNLDVPELASRHKDCGILMYDNEQQDVHSGGSGCGCVASVTSGHFIKQLSEGSLKRILVIATGALLSTTSFQQGENIPTIAHAVAMEGVGQ